MIEIEGFVLGLSLLKVVGCKVGNSIGSLLGSIVGKEVGLIVGVVDRKREGA